MMSWDSRAGGVSLADESYPWLAAYTRPRCEVKVKQYCDRWRIEAFLPTHRSWRQWSDRRVSLQLPLFPSYVFVRPAAPQRLLALQAPGALWYVRDSQGPVAVAADELQAVARLLASGLEYDPLPGVASGDEVEISRGPLQGCRGRLLRKDGGSVVLVVTAIGGAVRVKLTDTGAVRRVRLRPGQSRIRS